MPSVPLVLRAQSRRRWRASHLRPLSSLLLLLLLFRTAAPSSARHGVTSLGVARFVLRLLPRPSPPNYNDDLAAVSAEDTQRELEPTGTIPLPQQTRHKKESCSNFLYWLLVWPKRSRLPAVRVPVLCNVLWSSLLAYGYHRGQVTPLDATPHSYVAVPLGFLLTLRCTEGLVRCEKGREAWDNVLSLCRDIVRAVASLEGLLEPHHTRRLIDLTCAFALVLESDVMRRDRSRQLRHLLRDKELVVLKGSHASFLITEMITQALVEAARANARFRVSPQYIRLIECVDNLGYSLAQFERLSRHPVPQVYTAHCLRMLSLWAFALPLTLFGKVPLPAVPLVIAVITWSFFGLNEMGVRIQYPFHAGCVDLRSLWEEIIVDTRECFENARVAKSL